MNSKIDHNSHLTISVTAEEAGERLDSFLATRVEGWSRARLHRLIEDADVLINGETAKPAYKVRAADEIEIELTPSWMRVTLVGVIAVSDVAWSCLMSMCFQDFGPDATHTLSS